MDLGLWWKNRRWKALLELIEQLPNSSRTWEARLNDEEEAELILDSIEKREAEEGPQPQNVIAVREYDRNAMQLEDVKQLLSSLINTVRSAIGAKPVPHQRLKAETLLDEKTWERDVESVSPILEATGFNPAEVFGFDPDDE
ncbi:hypothetical protein [Nesterenkonia rhizosphaerae]|uniref:Uncharacterized protein n=1 Tax=Nesterenkonia rhizosphaerae TaxID=1348272 RepID=A0ABP9G037_9MICC